MRSERLIRYAAVLLLVLVAMGYIFVRFPTEREDTSTLLDFSEFYAAGDIVNIMQNQLVWAAAGGSRAAIGVNTDLTASFFEQ